MSFPKASLRCISVVSMPPLQAVADSMHYPLWSVCVVDELYSLCLWHLNPLSGQVAIAVSGGPLVTSLPVFSGLTGKPSCMRTRWKMKKDRQFKNASPLLLCVWLGTDRGSIVYMEFSIGEDNCHLKIKEDSCWVIPTTQFTTPPPSTSISSSTIDNNTNKVLPSKITALTLSHSSGRVAFIESVGRRIGTFAQKEEGKGSQHQPLTVEWLPTPLAGNGTQQEPGEALLVEANRIVATSVSNGTIWLFERSTDSAWELVGSTTVSNAQQLQRASLPGGSGQQARPRGAPEYEISSIRIVAYRGCETLLVCTSTGHLLLTELSSLRRNVFSTSGIGGGYKNGGGVALPSGSNWVVVASPYACSSVLSMDYVEPLTQCRGGDGDGGGSVYLVSTSGGDVSVGTSLTFQEGGGGGDIIGGQKLLDVCSNMRTKRLLASSLYWSTINQSAVAVFAFVHDSTFVTYKCVALSPTTSSTSLCESLNIREFISRRQPSTPTPLLLPQAKYKDLHCVAAVKNGLVSSGVVAGCEDGSLVVCGVRCCSTGSADSPSSSTFNQMLTGGTESNVLGVTSGVFDMGDGNMIPVVVSVGSLSTLCVWGCSTRVGFHLIHKQGKGGATSSGDGDNDVAMPRYLAVRLIQGSTNTNNTTSTLVVVSSSRGDLLVFSPQYTSSAKDTVSMVLSKVIRPHGDGMGGLPSPIFALDARSSGKEVVSGDKQGRLYYNGALVTAAEEDGSGGGGGVLTTLVRGSPINAVQMLNTPRLVAVGFDTSDLMVVSCTVGFPAVPLCRLGVGFSCIRGIAYRGSSSDLLDVLCDAEVHTLAVTRSGSEKDGTYQLRRHSVRPSAVRCSSGIVVVQRDEAGVGFRCVVGQGMEISYDDVV